MHKFNQEKYLDDLKKLVNIDSGSRNPAGTAQVAQILAGKYKELGWQITEHNFDSSIGPCLEIVNSTREKYDVLLIGHLDTVFPEGTATVRPFTIEGDKAYGPGVNDMKSGDLLMYYALKDLEEKGLLKEAGICVAYNSDEEISSRYSRSWIEELAKKSSRVLILEAARANGALVKERKGVGRFNIEFTGVAAHSGVDHEKGCSAVNELAHWILELHSLTNYDLGTTVNVGVVSGGTASNVVADKAQIQVDLRIREISEEERVIAALNNLKANPRTPGVAVAVTGGMTRPPMNANEKTEELCSLVERIGEKIGVEIKWTGTGGGSDGNFSAALGIPTIDGLGPVGGGSHSANEYLEINSIEPRFNLLREIILNLV
ncbi:MAG: M20 family metallopeptidase [Peptococcaceae bacterium]